MTSSSRTAVASRTGVVVGLAATVLGTALVWLTWRLFVTTELGQRLDQAALEGARYGRTRLWQVAEPLLEVVSVPALGLVLVATTAIAVLRRRWSLAVQIAVLVVGANLTTQVLKHLVLDRPDLGVTHRLPNALPSGHTTAAASVAAAAVLVVPPRARPWVALVGGGYATLTGVSTLVGQWHRPSDVIAGLLVVLVWGGITTVLAALGRRSPERERPAGRPGPRLDPVGRAVVTAGYLVALVTGAVAASAVATTQSAQSLGRTELLTAYAGGAFGVLATACAVFSSLVLMRALARPRPVLPAASA